jgi:hypothetical protein
MHTAKHQLSAADLHVFCWSGRAISDGVFAALVCDIMVHPDLQVVTTTLCIVNLKNLSINTSPGAMTASGAVILSSTPFNTQRQGLGKKMMAALLKHVRRRGPSSFGVFPRPKQVHSISSQLQDRL